METIAEQHRKHLAVMRGWLDGRRYYKAAEALEWSRRLEQGTRKDGTTPRFDHQLSIARLILTLEPHLQFPEETLVVCFLHDEIEDHGDVASRQEIERRFGTQVAEATWRMSKKGMGFTKTHELYFAELAECPIASVVKLGDRIHNVQTMPGVFTPEKQGIYLQEVDDWFFPLAKNARRNFPRQFGAYENLRILLRCQYDLLKAAQPTS
jgi:(p)ppGpp synthase/HD superfamily hydrolase